jgi:hypothetical protein
VTERRGGQPAAPATRKVILQGKLTSPHRLEKQRLRLAPAEGKESVLTIDLRPEGRDGKTWSFEEPLSLEPGSQQLKLLVTAGTFTDSEIATWTVHYVPPLPTVGLEVLPAGRVMAPQKPSVQARFAWGTEDRQPFTARVRILDPKGEVLWKGEEKRFEGEVQPWQVELEPRPGRNTVEVLLANRWQKPAPRGTAMLLYLRKPALHVQAPSPEPGMCYTTLKAEIETEPGQPLTDFRINGVRPFFANVGEIATQSSDGRTWEVRLPRWYLEKKGDNLLTVWASNDPAAIEPGKEGSIAQETVTVACPEEPLPPTWERKPAGGATDSPTCELPFSLRPHAQDVRVQLWRDGRQVGESWTRKDVAPEQAVGGILSRVSLDSGENRFELRAETSRGRATVPVSVLRLDLGYRLTWDQPRGEVDGPLLTLSARGVLTDLARKDEVKRTLPGEVQFVVNGIPQKAVKSELEWSAAGSSCAITYQIQLNQKENEIAIDRQGRGGFQQAPFHVRCARPRQPTLHLLVVTLEGKARQGGLPQEVLEAMQITRQPDKTLVSPVFEKVIVYPHNPRHRLHPVQALWTAKPGQVRGCLPWDNGDAGPDRFRPGDVFLVYWHANKDLRIDKATGYLPTTDSKKEPSVEDDVTLEQLLLRGDAEPRVKILLLDGTGKKQPPGDAVSHLLGKNAIILRYTRTGDAQAPSGLLGALREAARGGPAGQPVRLLDLIQAAKDRPGGELEMIAPEAQLGALSRVILRRTD